MLPDLGVLKIAILDHFRYVMVYYSTHMPEKTRPGINEQTEKG